jgi:hypothetical protein
MSGRVSTMRRSVTALVLVIVSIAVLVVARNYVHGPLYVVIFTGVTVALLFGVQRFLKASS